MTLRFKEQLSKDITQQLDFAKKKTFGFTKPPEKNEGKVVVIGDEDGDEDETCMGNLFQKLKDMPLLDAFNVAYEMLKTLKREACKLLPTTAHLVNFSDITMNALTVIQKDKFMSDIFHVIFSVAPLRVLGKNDAKILKYLGFNDALIETQKDAEKSNQKNVEDEKNKVVPKCKSCFSLRDIIVEILIIF